MLFNHYHCSQYVTIYLDMFYHCNCSKAALNHVAFRETISLSVECGSRHNNWYISFPNKRKKILKHRAKLRNLILSQNNRVQF